MIQQAQAVHEAAQRRLEALEAAERELDERFRTVNDATAAAAAELQRVAVARHAGEGATDADLDSARKKYSVQAAVDSAFEVEYEGVRASRKAAERALQVAERALDMAAAQAASELNREFEAKAQSLARELRFWLIKHRAAARYCNGAVAPNELIPALASGETMFQRDLRTTLFEPATADEVVNFVTADFLR